MTAKVRVLIVEDDVKTAATIERYLRHAGFETTVARDGLTGDRIAASGQADLIVLDIMLPNLDGMEICKRVRARGDAPVIMLTARADEEQRIFGLLRGADDYVIKPFSPRELVARVHAVLRRAAPHVRTPASTRFGALELDIHRRAVRVAGREIELTRTEYDILTALCSTPNAPWTRSALVERILGWDYEGNPRTIDTHVTNLRRKLDSANLPRQTRIETVFGVGYRFINGDNA